MHETTFGPVRQANAGVLAAAISGTHADPCIAPYPSCGDGVPKSLDFDAAYGIDLVAAPLSANCEESSLTPFGWRTLVWPQGFDPKRATTPVFTTYHVPFSDLDRRIISVTPRRPPQWWLLAAAILFAVVIAMVLRV